VINIFPYENETLVASQSWEEIFDRVSKEVRKPAARGIAGNLTGWVKDDEFQLTLRLRRQQLFMPVVNGTIDPTSKGSLIFLKYSLFPATRFLIMFWTIILPLTGIVISFQYKNYDYLAGFLLFLAILHGIAWANFKLHVKTTRQIIQRLMM
jgi:hypothetical protein